MWVAAKTAYTSLRIILVYECTANVVYFDGVQLFTASGQRISKTVNGTTYNYHYLGDQLVEMAWGANRMHFTYDAVGPLSVNFNGTEYFYLKNAQGDVTGLVDAAGTKVVSYIYSIEGEIQSLTGTMASTLGAMNPLRYRGYVYDTETGLYYLNTRYYNPIWGRFINADTPAVVTASPDSASWDKNLFAYCDGNPVNRVDDGGEFWEELALIGDGIFKGALFFGAVALVVTATAAITVASGGAGALLAAPVLCSFVETASVVFASTAAIGVTTATVGEVAASIERSKAADPDPYRRPSQKKQGRENKNKSRTKDNFKSRNNRRDKKPAPPKKHTPSRRGHSKYHR